MMVLNSSKISRRRSTRTIAVYLMLAAVTVFQEGQIRQNSVVVALTPVHQFSRRDRSPSDNLRRSHHGDDVSLQTIRTATDFPSSSSAAAFATPRRSVPPSDLSVRIKNRNASKMIRPRSLTSSPRITESLSIKKGLSPTTTYDALLTRDDERELTMNLRKLRAAVRIRDELVLTMASQEEGRRPTEQEWAEACALSVMDLRRVMYEGREARSKLVSANTGLVTSIAKRHYYSLKQATEVGGGVGTILTLQDMIQEGNLGLMEAAERFEPERGFKFSTYATWWIRQRVMRAISECSRTIRLPAHVHSMLTKINKARKRFQQENGRVPSVPELAHFLEMPVKKLQKYTDSSRNVVSLELAVRTSGGVKEDRRTIGDRLASDAPTPEEDVQIKSLQQDIRAVVNELAARERDVVVCRFGLDDGEPRTVEESAKLLGISRDRVRLIEARALNKLRHPQRNYRLKDYVGGDDEVVFEDEATMSPERIWSF